MIEGIDAGACFKLADLVDYKEGKVERRILAENEGMRLAVMAFDAGADLPAHPAPGDVLVSVLEGEAIIEYAEQEYRVSAGENFLFAKGGVHHVYANERMKMSIVAKLA